MEDPCQTLNCSYDTNPFDAMFTQNGWGRLVAVEYKRVLATTGCGLESGGAKFVEIYSYTAAGLVAKKRLRVTMKIRRAFRVRLARLAGLRRLCSHIQHHGLGANA
jgi:hypothetical protein